MAMDIEKMIVDAKWFDGTVQLTLDGKNISISALELTEYNADLDFRKYLCQVDGHLKSVVINCGVRQPYLSIEGLAFCEITHDTQDRLIKEFAKHLEPNPYGGVDGIQAKLQSEVV